MSHDIFGNFLFHFGQILGKRFWHLAETYWMWILASIFIEWKLIHERQTPTKSLKLPSWQSFIIYLWMDPFQYSPFSINESNMTLQCL